MQLLQEPLKYGCVASTKRSGRVKNGSRYMNLLAHLKSCVNEYVADFMAIVRDSKQHRIFEGGK